jgi:tRNA1Val (adenine37-N6)-methyltransferase
MANDYFHFKQFSIYQDRCAMKVGTDGVLLGAWVDTKNALKILDVGTGTGLIALMLAQRSGAFIDALEIDEVAAEQAKENVSESPWSNRITIHTISLQEYVSTGTKYDLIVSNPPYFSDFRNSAGTSRQLARQNSALSIKELLDGMCELLTKTGRIALIYPADSFNDVLGKASKRGLTAIRVTNVLPTPEIRAKRILAEFSFEIHETKYDELIIEEKGRHQYSGRYKLLTGEFYLDF